MGRTKVMGDVYKVFILGHEEARLLAVLCREVRERTSNPMLARAMDTFIERHDMQEAARVASAALEGQGDA